jgi:predicted HNH restriction endonuclease
MSTEIETIVNAPGFVLTYPKLEKIQADLAIFDHDTQQFMYHLLNGRYEEAQSYRNSILAEQEQLKLELEMRRKEKDEMIAIEAEAKMISIEEEDDEEEENIIIETTLLTE